MTTNERAELFAALAELARRYPHWRVGQLVANVAGWADADVWDAADDQLLAAARAHLGTATGPTPAAPSAGAACSLPEIPSPAGR
ncbi:hypothetical protein [Urbifossiella limnaea]|uniref:Uncharacterized protein n=1 Tax=Urbifossiella limnaea TaxID=2528023 RepID=A0A517Y0I1_9BACT|nr:hypothetical protein [Urbifossiella limnaea]QDU23266.1 hypothetical protein ETAA1_52600 [Urbifossiella limnaea]